MFKKTKKTFIFAIILMLALTQLAQSCALFGGGQAPQAPAQLVIWKPFEDKQSLNEIFQAYQVKYPNVSFVYVKKDIATYESELLNALAAGSGPDIFSIHNDWLPSYKNKLSPAPEGLYSDREFQETFVDVATNDLYDAEGNLYAVPMTVDVLALYYNRDLLGSAGIAQPPRTWAEVIEAVKKLTQQDRLGNFVINGIAMGTAQNINRSVDVLALLMLQNGTQVFNNQHTNAILNRDVVSSDGTAYNPAAQALEFYTQFANPAKPTYTWNTRNNYSIDAFVAGQAAMMLSYSYMADTIRGKAPLLNFGVAPAPQIDLSKPKINFGNYFAEGVSKASPNTQWAWDFLKFATSAESLASYYKRHLQPSARKDIISQQLGDPEVGVFAEGALTAKSVYKPNAAEVDTIFSDMIDDVVLRGKTPQQAVMTANQLLDGILRK